MRRKKDMEPRDYARFQLNHRRAVAVDLRNSAEDRSDQISANKYQKLINDINKKLGKLDKL